VRRTRRILLNPPELERRCRQGGSNAEEYMDPTGDRSRANHSGRTGELPRTDEVREFMNQLAFEELPTAQDDAEQHMDRAGDRNRTGQAGRTRTNLTCVRTRALIPPADCSSRRPHDQVTFASRAGEREDLAPPGPGSGDGGNLGAHLGGRQPRTTHRPKGTGARPDHTTVIHVGILQPVSSVVAFDPEAPTLPRPHRCADHPRQRHPRSTPKSLI
jgi:hypothetical protein